MTYKQIPIAPMLKGLAAETDIYTQPKGTFPRGSNLLLNKRGALDSCDGSQLVHAFNGQVQSGRGKVMASFLFSPTGVSSYYVALMKALDIPLGPPQNLTASPGSGGTLAAGTYYYKVTALDGADGETTASNEISATVSASGKVTLTWNFVPNAQSYNIYRGTAPGTESLLSAVGLPVAQVAFGNLTVSYVDTGLGISGPSATISSLYKGFAPANPIQVNLNSPGLTGLLVSGTFTIAGASPSVFNGSGTISSVGGNLFFTYHNSSVPTNTSGTGGTVTLPGNTPPPNTDTTQQVALYQMPVIVGANASLPVSYNNSNIVALFPADLPKYPGGGGWRWLWRWRGNRRRGKFGRRRNYFRRHRRQRLIHSPDGAVHQPACDCAREWLSSATVFRQ